MSKARLSARMILPLCLLLLARAPAQPMFADPQSDSPGFGLLAAETGGGLLLGAVGTAGLYCGLVAAWTKPGDDIEHQLMARVFGGLISVVLVYPVGCAAGTTIVGGVREQGGNFGLAYLGALVGLPVGYGIGAGGDAISGGSPILRWSFIALGCLAPPVGATVGYNLIRNPEPGLGRLDQRLLMPSIGLRSEPAGKETMVALDMKLLTVRF
jgi:hypothetical protein